MATPSKKLTSIPQRLAGKETTGGRKPAPLKEKGINKMGLHNGLVLLVIGFSGLGIGAMIEWAEWKVKKYIKSRKARR